jgi:hypothetical protein
VESEPNETHKQRVDRELIELLNELRLTVPGVQTLFAFLLILPFQQAFANLEQLAKVVYFIALVSSAISIALLIAPASYHRLNLRRNTAEKEEMLFSSSHLAIYGTVFLAGGLVCSMFVIGDVLFGSALGAVIAVATAAVFASLWYALPLIRRRPGTGEQNPDA